MTTARSLSTQMQASCIMKALDSKVMPWKFDIHYYIDGKEYSPEEIGGKSGAENYHDGAQE